MERKTFHSLILLISYAALLALVILRLNTILALAGKLLVVFKPLLIGFTIAFVLGRPCAFFRRQFDRVLPKKSGLSLGLAVLFSYLSLFAAATLIITFIVPQLYESVMALVERINANIPIMQSALNRLLDHLNLDAPDLTAMLPSLNDVVNGVINTLSSALPYLLSFTGNIMSSTITTVTALVFSVYMLAGRDRLTTQFSKLLRSYAPPSIANTVSRVAALTSDTFTKFVSGQLMEACILGFLCFFGMLLFRFPYAPLISVIIAISALIPVAGAYIGAILSALLLVMVSPVQALGFLVFLLVLQQLEGNLIYPRVVGSSIGLPALWVLTAVSVGGGLFGLLGMLLSVPAASVLYTLIRQDINARLSP